MELVEVDTPANPAYETWWLVHTQVNEIAATQVG